MMLSNPYYGIFSMTLNKKWIPGLGTAGVSKNNINMQLAIDPIFWKNLSQDHRIGVLTHEILHISYQHLSLREKYPDKELFNIAADIDINQVIDRNLLPGGTYPDKESFKKDVSIFKDAIEDALKNGEITEQEAKDKKIALPIRVLFLEDFPELNMAQNKGTDYYYKALEKARNEGNSPGLDDINGTPNNETDPNAHHSHPTWDEFSDLSKSEKRLIERQVESQMQQVAEQVVKSRGTVPGNIQSILDAISNREPPKFDWRAYLRNFVGGSTETQVRKTRRKKSKRFPKSPGLKVEEKLAVLVTIDTSGSVSVDELQEFFHEIHHMHRTGTSIIVLQYDTQISSVKKYKTSKDGTIEITGRGGTDFNAPVDYYNKNHKEISCMINFTDGEAPTPDNTPRGRVLWVLSSNSSDCEHLPGRTIKLN